MSQTHTSPAEAFTGTIPVPEMLTDEAQHREFIGGLLLPTEREWAPAWRRLTTIRQEEPVISLTDRLVRVEAFDVLQHQEEVALTADIMGQRQGFESDQLERLTRTGLVHDVGKAHALILRWTRSKERYRDNPERFRMFLAVVGRHSELGVDMIEDEEAPFEGGLINVNGVSTYVRGWDSVEKESIIKNVWGHHTFKTDPEQRYGIRPEAFDPQYTEALTFAVADTAAALASKRSYKGESTRNAVWADVKVELGVDPGTVDRLMRPARDEHAARRRRAPATVGQAAITRV